MSGASIPPLSPDDLSRLCQFVYKRSGILYGENKRFFVERRLIERMSSVGLKTFPEYFSLLLNGGAEAEQLINSFTVNETYFYREENQLRCLSKSLLPEIVQTRGPGDLVRIWSVPCSTGEEPYSIAIWLLENWHLVDAYNIEIVGSDIDTRVLAEAGVGIYSERALARLPKELVPRYFQEISAGTDQIIQDLRESVKFTHTNLVDAASMRMQGKFDIIFCRNVLIYFDDAARRASVENIYEALNPGGFICLGHSESMARISDRFRTRRFDDGIVYQRAPK